jgi:hypothetical protein
MEKGCEISGESVVLRNGCWASHGCFSQQSGGKDRALGDSTRKMGPRGCTVRNEEECIAPDDAGGAAEVVGTIAAAHIPHLDSGVSRT